MIRPGRIILPLWVIRLILFIVLSQLFPYLETCEIWILVEMILRRIARGRGVRPPPNPWGMDDDDDDDNDDDDIEYFREDIMTLLENLQRLRSCASPKKALQSCCVNTVFSEYVDDIISVLEEYNRLNDDQLPPTPKNIFRHSPFERCATNVAVIFGECFGKVELMNEFVPNNFNVILRGVAKAVLRNTKEEMSSADLWRKHLVVVSATTTCCPFKLEVCTTCEMITRITHTIRSLQSNTQIKNYLSNKILLLPRTRITHRARTQIPELSSKISLEEWLSLISARDMDKACRAVPPSS